MSNAAKNTPRDSNGQPIAIGSTVRVWTCLRTKPAIAYGYANVAVKELGEKNNLPLVIYTPVDEGSEDRCDEWAYCRDVRVV